ncbi:MAG: DNA polymerase III subunit delta' [Geminicoccales bacterium]
MSLSEALPEPAANPDLFGHDHAVQALEHALASSRLHHGWLFFGRRGIGKATLAYRFARSLLAGPSVTEPGLTLALENPIFRQVEGRHHPDLMVIEAERDPKTGKVKPAITVDRVRDATANLYKTPALAKRRVLIVDGAEQLNRNAANALLKPLEEPPSGAVLILISHRPGQVAATLRSRCAKLALRGLDDAHLQDLLSRHAPDLSDASRAAIVALAEGSLGRALDLAASDWLSTYEKVVRTIAADPPGALDLEDLAAALAKQSTKDGFLRTLDLLQTVFGRVVAQATGRLDTPLFSDELEAVKRLAARHQPLDCLASLWEKIGRLSAAVDGLNLDHTQALAQILTAMAATPKKALPFQRKASSLDSDLLGERHAIG